MFFIVFLWFCRSGLLPLGKWQEGGNVAYSLALLYFDIHNSSTENYIKNAINSHFLFGGLSWKLMTSVCVFFFPVFFNNWFLACFGIKLHFTTFQLVKILIHLCTSYISYMSPIHTHSDLPYPKNWCTGAPPSKVLPNLSFRSLRCVFFSWIFKISCLQLWIL